MVTNIPNYLALVYAWIWNHKWWILGAIVLLILLHYLHIISIPYIPDNMWWRWEK